MWVPPRRPGSAQSPGLRPAHLALEPTRKAGPQRPKPRPGAPLHLLYRASARCSTPSAAHARLRSTPSSPSCTERRGVEVQTEAKVRAPPAAPPLTSLARRRQSWPDGRTPVPRLRSCRSSSSRAAPRARAALDLLARAARRLRASSRSLPSWASSASQTPSATPWEGGRR